MADESGAPGDDPGSQQDPAARPPQPPSGPPQGPFVPPPAQPQRPQFIRPGDLPPQVPQGQYPPPPPPGYAPPQGQYPQQPEAGQAQSGGYQPPQFAQPGQSPPQGQYPQGPAPGQYPQGPAPGQYPPQGQYPPPDPAQQLYGQPQGPYQPPPGAGQSLYDDPHRQWGAPQQAPAGYGYGYGHPQPLTAAPSPMGFPAEDPVRPWPWWIAFVGLSAALVSIIAAGIALGVVIALFKGGDMDAVTEYDYLFGILQDVLWVAVAIGIPLAIVRWIRPEHLGLRSRPLGWSLLKAVLVLVGFYVLAAVYAGAMGLDDNSNQLLKDTGFGDTLGKDLAYAILYPIAAPVAEELLFRGVLYKGLRDGFRGGMGRGPAVALGALISGAIFGAAHIGGGQDDFIPVLIALGVLLAVAYEWSGTIYVPIFIHAVNNAIATASSADPTADWIFGILAAAPFIAVLVAMAIAGFVRRLRSEPPRTLPPSFPPPPPGWPTNGPPSGRPPGM